MPNNGVAVVVVAVLGGSTAVLPNEKTGAAAGVIVGAVAAGLAVKLEIPVIRLEPNDGVAAKLIGATDELDGEATEVVALVVGLFAPNLNSGRDAAKFGGETEAADDTVAVEIAGFGSANEIACAGIADTTSSGLLGENAKPPLR